MSCILLFCVVVLVLVALVVVTGVQLSLLSRCIVVFFSSCRCSCCCYCCWWCAVIVFFFFVVVVVVVCRHLLATVIPFLLLSRCIVVLCCFALFRIVVLFHLTFNLLSSTPIFWLVFQSKFGPTSRARRNENDVPPWSTAQEEKEGRGYEQHKLKNLFLFVLAVLFVLATLCVTVDGMHASAHPDLQVCLRDQARARLRGR